MLLTVGMDTQFGMTETLCGTIVESFPKYLSKRRTCVAAALCATFCLLGLPLTTQAGIYYFQIMDWYSTSFGLPLIGLTECVVFAWIYGTDKLSDDIAMMLGKRPPLFFIICWKYITPILLLITLVSAFVSYQAPKLDEYSFPDGAVAIGWIIAMMSVVPIPFFVAYRLITASGPIVKRLMRAMEPALSWGPANGTIESDISQSDLSHLKEHLNGSVHGDGPTAHGVRRMWEKSRGIHMSDPHTRL